MLMPKRVKRRKQFRGSMKGTPSRGIKITYGEYGLVAQEPCWIKSNQIEAARVALTRYLRRGGKVWIDIFPDKPVTAQPAETRMGSGKGAVDYWVAVVKPGRVLFEVAGVPEEDAREALRLAMHKLPCTCKIMSRAQTNGPDDVYIPREWKVKRVILPEDEAKTETAEGAESTESAAPEAAEAAAETNAEGGEDA